MGCATPSENQGEDTFMKLAEYIWLDGHSPTQQLRSKSRVVALPSKGAPKPADFPRWSFDGSSTFQSGGSNSDLLLEPVRVVPDPVRGGDAYLVLCEVLDVDGNPHASNKRASLRTVLDRGAALDDPWFGFEQEYTLYQGGRPLGWPDNGYPGPQGPYYCGVGAEEVFGRELVEEHTRACLAAGLLIYGVNAEVMPGQWEFQIGYRGIENEAADPLLVADHLWLARYLLARIGERHGIVPSLEPKPVKGDWNGAGAHTNFSTAAMRRPRTGIGAINRAIAVLKAAHALHIPHYGADLGERLTGLHETCSIHEFRDGVADRGASVRVPRHVAQEGHGYLEDRRPGANCDPYVVCEQILRTVCLGARTDDLALAS